MPNFASTNQPISTGLRQESLHQRLLVSKLKKPKKWQLGLVHRWDTPHRAAHRKRNALSNVYFGPVWLWLVMFKGLTLHDLTFDRFPSRELKLTAEQKGDAAWCKTHNWWINFTSRIQATRVINILLNIFSNDRTTMAWHLALSKTIPNPDNRWIWTSFSPPTF